MPLDANRGLLERVKAGSELSRAPRLRQLLEYLIEAGQPTEEQIGVQVFGRRPGYDTGTDTIVRVEVSKLRKKLEHYFLSEGAAEPIILEVPRRSYTPVFRPRDPAGNGEEPRGWALWPWLAALAAVSMAVAGWLFFENTRLRERLGSHVEATPYLDHFWSQIFHRDRQTRLVASDSMAMILCDFLGRTLTVPEYSNVEYPGNVMDREIRDPAVRAALRSEMNTEVTSYPDLKAAARIAQLAVGREGRLEVAFGREFRFQPHSPDNLILLSHRKANPWVSLFDERLNFQYEFRARPYAQDAFIVNRAPRPGEQARYPVSWGAHTYAVIARLHNPAGQGIILLLEGADTASVGAGCELLSEESRIKALYQKLNLRPDGALPDFEILLSVKLIQAAVLNYELLAYRILSN